MTNEMIKAIETIKTEKMDANKAFELLNKVGFNKVVKNENKKINYCHIYSHKFVPNEFELTFEYNVNLHYFNNELNMVSVKEMERV